jgi:DNA-binding response OmpR family regulator
MTVPNPTSRQAHPGRRRREDILETIADVLEDARVDRARDYATASRKNQEKRYDLAILDIMGVNGLQLLEEAVAGASRPSC